MKFEELKKTKVLFVCMGNICRSPTANAVFRQLIESAGLDKEIFVDSAGTHAYHIGDAPDQRAQNAALHRGYKMCDLRARSVQPNDFIDFDYILAMDNDNLAILQKRCPTQFSNKVGLLMQYCHKTSFGKEIADPYFGGQQGFETVLDMVEVASRGLIEHICKAKQ